MVDEMLFGLKYRKKSKNSESFQCFLPKFYSHKEQSFTIEFAPFFRYRRECANKNKQTAEKQIDTFRVRPRKRLRASMPKN